MINGRKLKKILNNKSRFLEWIKTHIETNGLKENNDYFVEKMEMDSLMRMNKEKIDYLLTYEACIKIIQSQSRNKTAEKIKRRLENASNPNEIIKEINKGQMQETKIIKFCDQEYPEQLKKIKNPPKQLYVKGNVQNLKEYGIAVIGTRDCTNYGRKVCKVFVNNLVGYKLNIISGLAVGIDSCAHKTCLQANGKTIAVLPSGFDNIFPKENEELLNQILESGGTVVTEYPPEFEKTQESCKERNRIVSGLAIATLVVEAEKRTGTTITVRYTNEQNKKVFCIPSSLLNSKGVGTNQMIKANKAKLVTKVEDIIEEFPELKLKRKEYFDFVEIKSENAKKKKEAKAKIVLKIDEENIEVYKTLSKNPKTIDEIAQVLNKPISEITYKLTLLELQGVIEEAPGKKFKIK